MGASIGTINNELTYLRAALKFAYRNQWIDTEPRVLVPRRLPGESSSGYNTANAPLSAAASMPHLRLFIALTILTQSRPKELLALKWAEVDLRRRLMEFRDSSGRGTAEELAPVVHKWLVRAQEASKSDFVIEWGDRQVVEIKRGFQMAAGQSRGNLHANDIVSLGGRPCCQVFAIDKIWESLRMPSIHSESQIRP